MKTALFFASCVIGFAESPMTAYFDNGDELHGNLGGVTNDQILWNSEAFDSPQKLGTKHLMEVYVSTPNEVELPPGDHIAVATLTNGDTLRGTLLNVDEESIGLKTSFGGTLLFRRDMVARLDIEDRPELYYSGPRSIDEWKLSEDKGWRFEAGRLICNQSSSIGREIGRHERVRIAFDVSWRENARFRLYLHADNEDIDKVENCFELVCQSQYAYIRKRTVVNNRKESTTIGTTGGVREFQEREKVRVEILQDLVTGRIRLILGDRVIADWTEQAPDPKKMGGFLHFLADQSSSLSVSRIRVTSWDGMVEGNWQQAPAGIRNMNPFGEEEQKIQPEEEKSGGIYLRNGDCISGDTVGIEDGKVTLKTAFKEFELPVSRLRTFALRTSEEAANPELCWKPIRRRNDIRAYFPDGGHITFESLGLEDGHFKARSQTFGEASFAFDAFSRLEFNLYRRNRKHSR